MSAWLVRWRLALRIARRDALRHKGRTLLVIAMVGLPVLAVVAADTLNRTNQISPIEALPSRLGSADVRIEGASRDMVYADPATGDVYAVKDSADPAWTRAEVAAALPDGSRIVQTETGRIKYRTGLGYAPVTGIADDLTDPMRNGAAELLEGRLPTADDEVAVSPTIARRGFGVGDELELTTDDVRARIVGVVSVGVQAGGPVVVLPAGDADLLQSPGEVFYATVPGELRWPAVRKLNEAGLVAVSRPVVLDPPPESVWLPRQYGGGDTTADPTTIAVLALIVVSVVLEVVLLAGPAFAVGVRRQRRDLALVAAAGGTPADLRRVVLAGGVVLGGGAAVLGAALGVGAARAAMPIFGRLRNSSFGPFDVSPLIVALVMLVGVVAGLAAAYVPARQAARTDVVSTLAGRRGQVRTSWRSPVVGLVLFAAGIAAVVVGTRGNELGVAGGAVLLVVGVVAAAPWLVGLLAPLARRLPTSGRLAVRDATRNRSRTAPAVAAVMATVAGVTALAIGSTSDSAQSRRDYVPQAPMGVATLQGDMDEQTWTAVGEMLAAQAPGRDVHRVRVPRFDGAQAVQLEVVRAGCTESGVACQWSPQGLGPGGYARTDLAVADARTVAATYPDEVAAQMAAAVDSGRVAVLGDGAVAADGTVQITAVRYDQEGSPTPGESVTLPATRVAALPRGARDVLSWVVIPPALAKRLPADLATSELSIGGPGHPVTAAEEQRMTEILTAQAPTSYLYVERGWKDALATPRLILAVLGALLVLIATLTATGLALADARPDFATLAAVGAAPRTRRFVAMGSAAVVGGLGAALGVLVGFAPGIAVTWPLTANSYGTGSAHPMIVIPWLLLATVAVAVPLLAVAVAGLVVRSRLPMDRRIA
ncbi:MAG: FtsX-like permease family protein [Blastococcus sp.]